MKHLTSCSNHNVFQENDATDCEYCTGSIDTLNMRLKATWRYTGASTVITKQAWEAEGNTWPPDIEDTDWEIVGELLVKK